MRRRASAACLASVVIAGFWFLPSFAVGQAVIEEAWSAGALHGTLLHRPAAPRGPAVLIIAGSGPTDRNGNGPIISTDTYRSLAHGLAEAGIRSLRYDKRGIGESRGLLLREDDAQFGDFVDDAVSAIKSLGSRSDVSAVIVAGHSEGALIAILAAQKIDVAGLMLLTATGRPLAAVLRDQLQTALPEALYGEAFATLDRLEAGETVPDVRSELHALFRPSVQRYLLSLIKIDPAVELAKLKTPVLLLYAGRDLQIGRSDFEALRRARPDARSVELPEANHTLKSSPPDRAGNIAMYTNRAAPLDPGVMPPLIDFVHSVAR